MPSNTPPSWTAARRTSRHGRGSASSKRSRWSKRSGNRAIPTARSKRWWRPPGHRGGISVPGPEGSHQAPARDRIEVPADLWSPSSRYVWIAASRQGREAGDASRSGTPTGQLRRLTRSSRRRSSAPAGPRSRQAVSRGRRSSLCTGNTGAPARAPASSNPTSVALRCGPGCWAPTPTRWT